MGTQMDFSNAWTLEIYSPHAFLSWLVSIVPNQSVWTVDGLYDRRARQFLKRFRAGGQVKMFNATTSLKLPFVEVDLNSESKPLIMAQIHQWNLDTDFIHQSIRCGDTVYFLAHDNLQDTWLSKRVTADQLRPLITSGVVSIRSGIEFEIASEERWQQLTAVLAALVEAQRTNSFQDIGYWSGLLGSEARATFLWEAEDCDLDNSRLGKHQSSESRFVDVFGTMIDQFKNGECKILGWRKLMEARARVEYEPTSYFGCLQVLVEAFGHRIDPVPPESVLLPASENIRNE